MKRILGEVVIDATGKPLEGVGSSAIRIEGSVTDTVLLTAPGVLMSLLVTKDVDGGTWTLKNTAGTTLAAGVTDYVGTIPFKEHFEAGVKITTANFTNGEMR